LRTRCHPAAASSISCSLIEGSASDSDSSAIAFSFLPLNENGEYVFLLAIIGYQFGVVRFEAELFSGAQT
jgi:hypothetical protein